MAVARALPSSEPRAPAPVMMATWFCRVREGRGVWWERVTFWVVRGRDERLRMGWWTRREDEVEV